MKEQYIRNSETYVYKGMQYSKGVGRQKVDLFPLLRLMFDSTKEETASVSNTSISILQASVYIYIHRRNIRVGD